MTLTERFNCIRQMCEELQSTNSIVEKREIINKAPIELKDDINYILEVLAGQHKFGFTYVTIEHNDPLPENYECKTIKEYMSPLNQCNLYNDWSTGAIIACCQYCRWFSDIVGPIANRTLRLGIGKSLLPTDSLTPMLGKAFEGQRLSGPLYVTEKLDGNRCFASFDGLKWNFTSRSGKPMKVQFDMTGLPTEYIYDGEILSLEQTKRSINLYAGTNDDDDKQLFNSTSGLINSKYGDKSNLVYNIFDIVEDNVPYLERRETLNGIHASALGLVHSSWRILPVLSWYSNYDVFNNEIHNLLDDVTSKGAEGLMINVGNANYVHKRTNDLLKYKKVRTVDLYVADLTFGTGKYEGMVGALECVGKVIDHGVEKLIAVDVGSGLTDEQRLAWALNPDLIKGKIVEIAYFSESQNKHTDGTVWYSLRFPRLKKVRNDKKEVSVW